MPKGNKNELRGFDHNSLGAIASSDDFDHERRVCSKEGRRLYLQAGIDAEARDQIQKDHAERFLPDRPFPFHTRGTL